jgi:hypothetical protein
MTIKLEPDTGIPVYDDDPAVDLSMRARAATVTAKQLEKEGKTSKKATKARVAELTPASLVLTNNILSEFGRSVVESAISVRHLITNKLILETENPDAKVRLRALELLGKISDVGLFAEKSEVTVTHQSTDDLKKNLRKKLEKLVNPPEVDGDAVVIDAETVDE